MILTYKFVRLIENHSDALASGLLRRVQQSERTEAYRNVPAEGDLAQNSLACRGVLDCSNLV
jgi:hypothetical protein